VGTGRIAFTFEGVAAGVRAADAARGGRWGLLASIRKGRPARRGCPRREMAGTTPGLAPALFALCAIQIDTVSCGRESPAGGGYQTRGKLRSRAARSGCLGGGRWRLSGPGCAGRSDQPGEDQYQAAGGSSPGGSARVRTPAIGDVGPHASPAAAPIRGPVMVAGKGRMKGNVVWGRHRAGPGKRRAGRDWFAAAVISAAGAFCRNRSVGCRGSDISFAGPCQNDASSPPIGAEPEAAIRHSRS